jgi:hypothetical protein
VEWRLESGHAGTIYLEHTLTDLHRDERHPRMIALRDEHPALVHHHPPPVIAEAERVRLPFRQGDAGRGLDGVDIDGGKAQCHVEIRSWSSTALMEPVR